MEHTIHNSPWETTLMPSIREFHMAYGHLNVPRSHPVIGEVVHRIRSGRTTIPPQYLAEVRACGLS